MTFPPTVLKISSDWHTVQDELTRAKEGRRILASVAPKGGVDLGHNRHFGPVGFSEPWLWDPSRRKPRIMLLLGAFYQGGCSNNRIEGNSKLLRRTASIVCKAFGTCLGGNSAASLLRMKLRVVPANMASKTRVKSCRRGSHHLGSSSKPTAQANSSEDICTHCSKWVSSFHTNACVSLAGRRSQWLPLRCLKHHQSWLSLAQSEAHLILDARSSVFV